MNWLREADTEPIPGYILIAPLGTGGFGEVWKCRAPGGIFKAIKFVFGNLNSLDDDSAKAEQEFKALERVKAVRHPFVLSMERIDIVNGELLIVMELADKSLHDLFLEHQALEQPGIPRDVLLGYLADVAEGLDHLIEKHALQHLDVKPKNLFLIGDRVKVADFGLVKHLERQSQSGLMGGITPVYAAPETFTNKISKNSDQYSLAVLYIELLTGRRPFSGKNIRQLAMQHMTETPDLSMLPESDRPAVARALSKDPEDRFPSCVEFLRALGGGTLRSEVSGVAPKAANRSLHSHGTQPEIKSATIPATKQGTPSTVVPTLNRKTPSPIPNHILNRIPESLHSQVSMSVSFQPEVGVLRPVLLIGIGSFGRRALQQVRCRLLDRVGEPSQVPCFRFLHIDTDPEPSKKQNFHTDTTLHSEHVFHAPLQPVNAYRRRQLDQILEWLPREKLYSIPRSLKVDGSRALGRLAFTESYLRFVTRLRHELQIATHPEAISQSSDHTGLPVRSKVPSVYIFASASGGTSGMIMDVGLAVRRTLERFNLTEATTTAFIFAGATEDASSPPQELANIFATLTELNHYADPEVKFVAQYGGPEGPTVENHGLPFDATYLLPMVDRTSEAFRDCIAHLAGYVTHDLTTPLGTGLEKIRKAKPPLDRTPFRGFGTFGVWYPRGLLLRSAARQLCAGMLRNWAAFGQVPLPAEAEQVLTTILDDRRLTPDEIQRFIGEESATGPDGNPVVATRTWRGNLVAYAEAAANRPDPQSWAVAAWDQCRDLVGLEPTTEGDSTFRRGRLSRALDLGIHRAVDAWQNEITEFLRPLEELTGPRLAIAEVIIHELVGASAGAAQSMEQMVSSNVEARLKAKDEVQAALDACKKSDENGFSIFGGRMPRALRNVAEKVRAFTDHRLKEDLSLAASQFYRRLQLWFEDKLRDITLTRQRLNDLAGTMEAHFAMAHAQFTPPSHEDTDQAMQTTLQETNTMRVVLPYGEDHLDRSAAEMLGDIQPEEKTRLELILTRLIVEPRGGLLSMTRGSTDLQAILASPMIDQTAVFLAKLLPSEDVTAVELQAAEASGPGDLARRIAGYVRGAAPVARGPASEEKTFVMVPDTEAGSRYAQEVQRSVPGAVTVPVRGSDTDLLFCREQACLRMADLDRFLEPCWEAYQESLRSTDKNPHARFDVTAWLPLVDS